MSKRDKPAMILKATASFGTSSASAELKLYDRYDFIPTVKIIEPTEKDEYSIKKIKRNEKIDLGTDFIENLRSYIVPEILIKENERTKINLEVIKGHALSGFIDDDGIIEFSCSNKNVNIKDRKVKYGEKIEIEIDHNLNIGEKFSI